MIKTFRILFSFLAVFVILLSCSLPVMASDIEPGDLPGSIAENFYDYDFIAPAVDPDVTITSQPNDIYANAGNQVSLYFGVSGDIKRIAWYYRTSENGSWKFLDDGYDEATISFIVADNMNGYQYMCRVTDSNGYYLNSNIVMLHIVDNPVFDNKFTILDVLDLFNTGAAAVVSWFSSVMDSTGAGTVYIAMMSVVLSVAILLGPLLGSARSGLSDVVHRPRHKEDDK